jgi:hypothetical protein
MLSAEQPIDRRKVLDRFLAAFVTHHQLEPDFVRTQTKLVGLALRASHQEVKHGWT